MNTIASPIPTRVYKPATLTPRQTSAMMLSGWSLIFRTHPTSAVLSDAWYFAKRVTLSLALRSSGDAGRGFGRVGAAAALVAG